MLMSQDHLSREQIAERGEEIYTNHLRDRVETDENIGKIIVIDVETGDYEIDDDGLQASHRIRAKHPDGTLYGLRIGYDAVEGFGSTPTRLKQ
jgi:hypothetical protein